MSQHLNELNLMQHIINDYLTDVRYQTLLRQPDVLNVLLDLSNLIEAAKEFGCGNCANVNGKA